MTATPQPAPGVGLTRQRVSAILLAPEAVSQITPLLPRGVSLEAVMSEVNRAVIETPEILDATPASIIMAVSQCVKWDLAIGETVYLVPFNVKISKPGAKDEWEKRIKPLRDYKGMAEMVVRAGGARSIIAKNVYEKEPFKYHEGTDPWIEHYPIMDPRARGPQIGSYAVARITQTMKAIVVLSVQEIEAIRAKHSKQWKTGALPDWYGPKTCVHRVTKLLPKNARLEKVISEFDEEEEIPEGEFEVVGTEVAAGAKAEEPVQATANQAMTPASAAPSTPEPTPTSGKPIVPVDRRPTEEQTARLLELAANEAVDAETKERVEGRLAECTIDSQTAKLWIGLLEEKVSQSAASQELFAPASTR